MANHIFVQAMKAAISAFKQGKAECRIHGLTLRIQHAHHEDYQVLLPDQSEIFRIVGNKRHAEIFAV